jgi:hypothetical protein
MISIKITYGKSSKANKLQAKAIKAKKYFYA